MVKVDVEQKLTHIIPTTYKSVNQILRINLLYYDAWKRRKVAGGEVATVLVKEQWIGCPKDILTPLVKAGYRILFTVRKDHIRCNGVISCHLGYLLQILTPYTRR
jgi:hypothetical protein